jgi:4-methylaminobutanoate oxidase (formaldehyde-forming)
MDNTDSPREVGLMRFADFEKPGGFIGKDALQKAMEAGEPESRLVQFLLEDPEPLLYGSEPIFRNGQFAGTLTTGGYGHTLGGAVGLGNVDHPGGVSRDYIQEGDYMIEVAGEFYSARASLRPMYDPEGKQVRS